MNSQREKPQRFSCQITCVEKPLETSGRHLQFPFYHLLFLLFFFKCFRSYFIYFSHFAIHIGLCSRFRPSLSFLNCSLVSITYLFRSSASSFSFGFLSLSLLHFQAVAFFLIICSFNFFSLAARLIRLSLRSVR